jgi:hypothetical protein
VQLENKVAIDRGPGQRRIIRECLIVDTAGWWPSNQSVSRLSFGTRRSYTPYGG